MANVVDNTTHSKLMDKHLEAAFGHAVCSNKITRDAMGAYIVPPGGKPLTSLGDCIPAPSDYYPKIDLTKEAAPQYSLTGDFKFKKCPYEASPADNNTRKDIVWSDRTVTLKGKTKLRTYDVRDDAHINDSVGPAAYNVQYNKFGSTGNKYILGDHHHDGINAGHPNKLVQPVDTNGFDTPGPDYRPNSSYWGRGHKKTFGFKESSKEKFGPAPNEYILTEEDRGPAYSFAKRLPSPLHWSKGVNKESPGPGTYDIDTTIGKALKKSVSGRPEPLTNESVPAPNVYVIRDTIRDGNAATLTYRTFEPTEKPHPGPDSYSLRNTNLPKAPVYTTRKLTKPTFPDILRYPIIAKNHEVPGPGSYKIPDDADKNDKPKYSMGKRVRTARNSVPGPNHYEIAVPCRPDAKKAPMISMAKRFPTVDKQVGPGPAAYSVDITSLHGKTGFSMTRRPKTAKNFKTPAPNAYNLKEGQSASGICTGPHIKFKSRASPYVFSGFRSTKF